MEHLPPTSTWDTPTTWDAATWDTPILVVWINKTKVSDPETTVASVTLYVAPSPAPEMAAG